VDIPKPPLWEISSDGAPLRFLTLIPLILLPPPELHETLDEKQAREFAEAAGMSSHSLLVLAACLSIAGLVCFCVICPIMLSPQCLTILRRNAPEFMDARRGKQLQLQLESTKKIEALEQALRDKAIVVDEWGIKHRVKTPEQAVINKTLEEEKRKCLKLEALASANERQRRLKKEDRDKRKVQHAERLKRMRAAYKTKTIAIDGIALRAPPAVLMELGFDADMIEAFGLPGFEGTDEVERDLQHADDEEAEHRREEEQEELMAEADELAILEHGGKKALAMDLQKKAHDDKPSEQRHDDEEETDFDPLQVPPRLDEIMSAEVPREGARHRKRRGAMAGAKEGEAMSRETVMVATRIAGTLHVSDLQEEDEVAMWLTAWQDREAHAKAGVPEELEKLIDFDRLEEDKEKLATERALLEKKFDKRKISSALAGDPKALEIGKAPDPAALAAAEVDNDEEMEFFDLPEHLEMHVFDHGAAALKAQYEAERVDMKNIGKEKINIAEILKKAHEEEEALHHVKLVPYNGRRYPGMPVRPRGLGTPRGLQFDGEVYRTSQLADEVPGGGGVQWGRYAQQTTDWFKLKNAGKQEEDAESEGSDEVYAAMGGGIVAGGKKNGNETLGSIVKVDVRGVAPEKVK